MKKTRLIFLFVTILGLVLSSSAAYARDDGPSAPTGINTFEVAPDPQTAGSAVTISINVNITAGGDGNTGFCLYAPETSADFTFPDFVTLSYTAGFPPTKTDKIFSATATDCSPGTSEEAKAYEYNGGDLPTGETTYEGSLSITIPSGATPGTSYTWKLYLGEPGGTPNPLSYNNFEITAVETPDTGLSGRLIDSKTLQPWLYGAEIKVVQISGDNLGIKGSTYASLTDGTWSIEFDSTDNLSLCSGNCSAGNEYAQYQIVIHYKCDLATANGTRTDYQTSTDANCPTTVSGTALNGLPVRYEETVTDSASNGVVNVGDIETSRGPTALTLQSFAARSNASLVYLTVIPLMVVLGAAGVVRNRKNR